MSIFTPHSTRSASTSRAATRIPIDTVLKTGDWRSMRTFAKHYNKDIIFEENFVNSILTRLFLTFYLSDETLLLLSEFVLQMKFISFQFPISLSCSVSLNISANSSESGNKMEFKN